VLARSARQALLTLEWPLVAAVEDALGVLERDPHAGHELRGRLRGLRSLRVGTYRIIYQLHSADRSVRVAAIRHRSIAYRRDPR
jgi:mRNA interferase RelE/StbE